MSESRITEIVERWKDIAAVAQCEEWWYSAIRHCQRNVDDLCSHESWGGGRETDQPDIHPSRYEGTAYAHAAEDIHYLLAVLSDKEERAVLDAPRIWWCEVRYMGFTGTASACATHAKCGWKRLVDDPQEGGEE